MADPNKCAQCRWFEPHPPRSQTDTTIGECRCNTPSSSDGWPKVYPEDWCGNWANTLSGRGAS